MVGKTLESIDTGDDERITFTDGTEGKCFACEGVIADVDDTDWCPQCGVLLNG